MSNDDPETGLPPGVTLWPSLDPGPQVQVHGRLHVLTVEIYAPAEASPGQVAEWVEYELGSGGLDLDHPMVDSGGDVRSVTHERDTGLVGYTLWDAQGEGCDANQRKGTRVHLRDGDPFPWRYDAALAAARPEKEEGDV